MPSVPAPEQYQSISFRCVLLERLTRAVRRGSLPIILPAVARYLHYDPDVLSEFIEKDPITVQQLKVFEKLSERVKYLNRAELLDHLQDWLWLDIPADLCADQYRYHLLTLIHRLAHEEDYVDVLREVQHDVEQVKLTDKAEQRSKTVLVYRAQHGEEP